MEKLTYLQEMVAKQRNNRPFWENNSPEGAVAALVAEAHELQKASDEFEVTPDAECNLIGEIGDIGYLLLTLCDQLGISLEDAIKLKMARNEYKYPSLFQQNGLGPEEALQQSKTIYSRMGGDHNFFQAYGDTVE